MRNILNSERNYTKKFRLYSQNRCKLLKLNNFSAIISMYKRTAFFKH